MALLLSATQFVSRFFGDVVSAACLPKRCGEGDMIPRCPKVNRYPVTFSACYSKKNKQYPYSRKIGLITAFSCRLFFHYHDDSLPFSPRFIFIANSLHTNRCVNDEAANIVSAGLCAYLISFYHKKLFCFVIKSAFGRRLSILSDGINEYQ